MKDEPRLQQLLQTLGDANRLKIIGFIGGSERSVSEIVKAVELSQPLVSHHLRTLRNSHILATRRKGPFVFYRVAEPMILQALGLFLRIADRLHSIVNKRPMFVYQPPRTRSPGKEDHHG